MTARKIWLGLLTELSKHNAPSMLLQDFNYFFNKAVNLYINKRYNVYDLTLQTTDDLRVLKSTAILDARKSSVKENSPLSLLQDLKAGKSQLFGATYEVDLPSDYLHILNCICIYKVKATHECYDPGNDVAFPAKRLTADTWSVISNDYYNRPLPERPYYYIHNVNQSSETPTDPVQYQGEKLISGTDVNIVSEFPLSISLKYTGEHNVEIETHLGNYIVFKPNVTYDFSLTSIDNKQYYCIDLDLDTLELIEDLEDELSMLRTVMQKALAPDITKLHYRIYIELGENNTFTKILRVGYYTEPTLPSETPDEKYISGEVPNSAIKQLSASDMELVGLPRTLRLNLGKSVSTIDEKRVAGVRYGNSSRVRLEIRYGHDDTIFELLKVFIDYIKAPQHIRLTLEQVNLTEDTSLVMEFPDYVCLEIINELVTIVMENTADPRLLTHTVVSQSIAQPAQQLAQPQASGSRRVAQA